MTHALTYVLQHTHACTRVYILIFMYIYIYMYVYIYMFSRDPREHCYRTTEDYALHDTL